MTEITKITDTPAPLSNFETAQRQAKALSASDLVPAQYKGNVANTLVALEIANRIGASPLMVMQNLHIIHGRPSWSSTFVIAAINGSGKFTALRFVGDLAKGIKAVATEKATGETIEGPTVTMEMANAEGWVSKAGSKWKTMPELMMRYRAAAFFGRLYAPEITMGMHSVEEVVDITTHQSEVVQDINAKILTEGLD
jgi:hypothetical protein